MPEITILEPITGNDAYKFQKCFVSGVVVVEKVKGIPTARVENARKDTVSRECLRHAEFEDKVKLTRIRNHFICNLIIITLVSIESTGAYKSAEIFEEACLILESKCDGLLQALEHLG
jgi:DNA-directed RNA polymerases I and III subunit RPAC1